MVRSSFTNKSNIGDHTFEREIVHYLRNGLDGRSMHHLQQQRDGPVPPLDLVFALANLEDIAQFGSSICGYYKPVKIDKKMLYEAFGKLLDEFSSVSIQFRIYPQRE